MTSQTSSLVALVSNALLLPSRIHVTFWDYNNGVLLLQNYVENRQETNSNCWI